MLPYRSTPLSYLVQKYATHNQDLAGSKEDEESPHHWQQPPSIFMDFRSQGRRKRRKKKNGASKMSSLLKKGRLRAVDELKEELEGSSPKVGNRNKLSSSSSSNEHEDKMDDEGRSDLWMEGGDILHLFEEEGFGNTHKLFWVNDLSNIILRVSHLALSCQWISQRLKRFFGISRSVRFGGEGDVDGGGNNLIHSSSSGVSPPSLKVIQDSLGKFDALYLELAWTCRIYVQISMLSATYSLLRTHVSSSREGRVDILVEMTPLITWSDQIISIKKTASTLHFPSSSFPLLLLNPISKLFLPSLMAVCSSHVHERGVVERGIGGVIEGLERWLSAVQRAATSLMDGISLDPHFSRKIRSLFTKARRFIGLMGVSTSDLRQFASLHPSAFEKELVGYLYSISIPDTPSPPEYNITVEQEFEIFWNSL